MKRRLVTVALVVLGLVLVVSLGLTTVYWGSQQVPEFYEQALAEDPQAAEQASGEMLEQAAALASDIEQGGRWEAVFTAEQINGWLAVDMERNYPDLLPSSLSDPRVAIEPDTFWIACRIDRGKLKGVVSMAADAYLARTNVVALRIRHARAGILPLPLDDVDGHGGEDDRERHRPALPDTRRPRDRDTLRARCAHEHARAARAAPGVGPRALRADPFRREGEPSTAGRV